MIASLRVSAAITCLALLAAPAVIAQAATAHLGPVIGAPAPAFDLPTIDRKRVTLADLRGRTVVVNAWATWCPPCRQETPDLIKAYTLLGGKDVAFVGVDSTESAALVKAFVAAKGIAWTQAIDADHAFAKAYDIRYFPTTYVIDPQGILRMTYVDVVTPKLLASFVADAKAGKNSTVVSRLQTKIDALLSPARFSFTGSDAGVMSTIEQAKKTIARVDAMGDDSDPAAGNPIDLPRTQAEENALRERAIAALTSRASTSSRKVMLGVLEGDAQAYAGQNAAALHSYQAALALDPANADALDGVSRMARQLKEYDVMVRADERLISLHSGSVPNLVRLGLDSGVAHNFALAQQSFNDAVQVATRKAAAKGAATRDVRLLAWTHLYYGRTEAKAGEIAAAKAQFALATQAALRLPKNDSRYAIYLEQAQEETVALDLNAASKSNVALSLAPWTGPDLPGSTPGTAKYRLVVAGRPGESVDLRATEVPKKWIASFCTDRFCAPMHLTTTLSAAGIKVIEVQLVPPEPKALHHLPRVRVIANDGKSTASLTTMALR